MITFFEIEDKLKFILLAIATARPEFPLLRNHLKRETGSDIVYIDILCYQTDLLGVIGRVVRIEFYLETFPTQTSIEVVFKREGLSISGRRYFMDDQQVVKKINSYEVRDGTVHVDKKKIS